MTTTYRRIPCTQCDGTGKMGGSTLDCFRCHGKKGVTLKNRNRPLTACVPFSQQVGCDEWQTSPHVLLVTRETTVGEIQDWYWGLYALDKFKEGQELPQMMGVTLSESDTVEKE